MRRRHSMPFGAELQPDGVRFRLWAPDVDAVELCLPGPQGERVHRMQRQAEGFFQCLAAEADAGCRYRFRIDGGLVVPDPASRCQPDDVHGASMVIDPWAFRWADADWRGRPWEQAVIYELHVGTFSPAGSFAGVAAKLDHLAALGVTAIELMPLAEFPGGRGWGYDGTLPFAPEAGYGAPDDLKRLVQAAHARGLMMILDVVYNHFGPDGNYLGAYASRFFTDRHRTPWGKANNFDGPNSRPVRDFFIHNALYWLEEYHFDGLRLDAVHAILDDSAPPFLEELAETARSELDPGRQVHLILENDLNQARLLARDDRGSPRYYTAQWNDDIHHVLHHLITGEAAGYYHDYVGEPMAKLGRGLTQGFVYQGEASAHRGGRPRGEPSAALPAAAFISFLQNHDQIGNRAFGERVTAAAPAEAVRAAVALLLLAPSPPLLFMGEEWAATAPFLYFCSFDDELGAAVRRGRREEFASFPEFADGAARDRIPDPNAPESFAASRLDWSELVRQPHRDWLAFYSRLLELRRDEIVPRLAGMAGAQAGFELPGGRCILAHWRLGDGSRLAVLANLAVEPAPPAPPPQGRRLFATHDHTGRLAPWSVAWYLAEEKAA